jgi:hypothetical protein
MPWRLTVPDAYIRGVTAAADSWDMRIASTACRRTNAMRWLALA